MRKRAFFSGWSVLIILAHVFFVASCSDSLDDPDDSNTILRIESIVPSPVESDIIAAVLETDTIRVTVEGIARSGSVSEFTDVQLESYTVRYSPPLSTDDGPIAALNHRITFVVPAGGSISFDAVAIPSTLKDDSLGNGIVNATIIVAGRDLTGDPASASGVFTIILEDFGDDTDLDGVRDDIDNCPNTPNPSQADCDGDGAGDACDNEEDDPDCFSNQP